MKHGLMALPYPLNALEPVMSQETLVYHYGKHHQTYINKLNELILWTEYEEMSLEDIIKNASGWIFNNAAQIWNHNLFWKSFASPENNTSLNFLQASYNTSRGSLLSSQDTSLNSLLPGEKKLQELAQMIDTSFWSFEEFQAKFKAESLARFGSGWTWLVQKWDTLEIYSTSNAENPLTLGWVALLWLDVWEHSYYIDYRNDRWAFVDNFWKIVDWEVVAQRVV